MTAAKRYPQEYPCCKIPDNKPRAGGGTFSRAVAAACPQIPPMAIPNKDLTARNCEKVLQNPEASSKTQIRTKLPTKVHFRPNRSARAPKMRAPSDRKRRVRVMAVVIWGVVTPKAMVSRDAVRETAKKSYPSQVQAHQPLQVQQ